MSMTTSSSRLTATTFVAAALPCWVRFARRFGRDRHRTLDTGPPNRADLHPRLPAIFVVGALPCWVRLVRRFGPGRHRTLDTGPPHRADLHQRLTAIFVVVPRFLFGFVSHCGFDVIGNSGIRLPRLIEEFSRLAGAAGCLGNAA